MAFLHRASSATTQQLQQRRRPQWRRHLLSGPILVALTTLDLSSASLWAAAPGPPQTARVSIQHVTSTPSAFAGRLAVGVRGGATQSDEDGEDEGDTHEVRGPPCKIGEGRLDCRFLVEMGGAIIDNDPRAYVTFIVELYCECFERVRVKVRVTAFQL